MIQEISLPARYSALSAAQRRQAREQYARLQDGKCQACGHPLTGQPSDLAQIVTVDESLFPPNFFRHPVHLHHSHETGLTIGAVHCLCNAILWQHFGE